MEKIKWVLFDLGGVVVHLLMQNPDGYTFKTRFFNQKELEGLFYTKEYINYMKGMISHEQFIGKYLQKKKLDLSVAELDELIKQDIRLIPGIEELLAKLSTKYKIALATNEGKVFTKYKVEGSGIMQYLSKVIASYLLREVKPSPLFFKKMLGILDIKSDECIFIDDTQENIDAAKALGIKSFLFTNVPQLERDLNTILSLT